MTTKAVLKTCYTSDFSLLQSIQSSSVTHTVPYSMDTRGSTCLKHLKHANDLSLQCNAEIKNVYRYNTTPPYTLIVGGLSLAYRVLPDSVKG